MPIVCRRLGSLLLVGQFQRQHGQPAAMGFIQVFRQRLLDLRRQIVFGIGIPEGFAHLRHGSRQSLQTPHDARAAAEGLDSADGRPLVCRRPRRIRTVTRSHPSSERPSLAIAYAVALRSRLACTRRVNCARRCPVAGPEAKIANEAIAAVVANQIADRLQECQIALLRLGTSARSLEDLDRAQRHAVDDPRRHDQEQTGRVPGGVVGRRLAVRDEQAALAGFQHRRQSRRHAAVAAPSAPANQGSAGLIWHCRQGSPSWPRVQSIPPSAPRAETIRCSTSA